MSTRCFRPSVESESKDQPGCGNGRTRGRQGQLDWLVIAKALKMDPEKTKSKNKGISVSRISQTRESLHIIWILKLPLYVSVSLPPEAVVHEGGMRHVSFQKDITKLKTIAQTPCKTMPPLGIPKRVRRGKHHNPQVGQSKIFCWSEDLNVCQGSKAKPNMMVKVNKGIVQSRPGMCVCVFSNSCRCLYHNRLRSASQEWQEMKAGSGLNCKAPAGPLFVMYVGDNPVIPVHSKNPSS